MLHVPQAIIFMCFAMQNSRNAPKYQSITLVNGIIPNCIIIPVIPTHNPRAIRIIAKSFIIKHFGPHIDCFAIISPLCCIV